MSFFDALREGLYKRYPNLYPGLRIITNAIKGEPLVQKKIQQRFIDGKVLGSNTGPSILQMNVLREERIEDLKSKIDNVIEKIIISKVIKKKLSVILTQDETDLIEKLKNSKMKQIKAVLTDIEKKLLQNIKEKALATLTPAEKKEIEIKARRHIRLRSLKSQGLSGKQIKAIRERRVDVTTRSDMEAHKTRDLADHRKDIELTKTDLSKMRPTFQTLHRMLPSLLCLSSLRRKQQQSLEIALRDDKPPKTPRISFRRRRIAVPSHSKS